MKDSLINILFCAYTGNLTCGTSDPNHKIVFDAEFGVSNCTKRAWNIQGRPELSYYSFLTIACPADGRTAAYRLEFELRSCELGNGNFAWMSYHSCCFSKFILLVGK